MGVISHPTYDKIIKLLEKECTEVSHEQKT